MILFHTSESTIFGKKQNDIVSTNAVSPICHSLSDVLLIDNKIKVLVNQKYLQKRVGFLILANITFDQVWCRNWEKNTFCFECTFRSKFSFLSFSSSHISYPIEVEIFCKNHLVCPNQQATGERRKKYWRWILGSRGRPFYGFPLPLFCGDYHNMWQWRWQLFWCWIQMWQFWYHNNGDDSEDDDDDDGVT